MTMPGSGPWIVGEGFPDVVATVFQAGDTIINDQGLFVYSGTPGPGNLIFSIASSAGTDQFGNVYGQGVNAGDQAGAHLSVSEQGDLLIANAADEPVAFWYHGDGSLRLYNPAGISAGNLATSVSPASGTDSAGNAYPPGVASFIAVTGLFAGAYAVILNDQTQSWGASVAALLFNNLTNPADLSPAVTAQTHATAGNNINIQSGKSASTAEESTIQVQDSVSSGFTGGLVDVLTGALQVTAADGNTYDTERLTLVYTGSAQTINSTTPAVIGRLSAPIAVGTYKVSGKVWGLQGSTTAAQAIRLTGSGGLAVSTMAVDFLGTNYGSFTSNLSNYGKATALNTDMFVTETNGFSFTISFEGIVIVSTAGTVNLEARCVTSASDTWEVLAPSFLQIEPITV